MSDKPLTLDLTYNYSKYVDTVNNELRSLLPRITRSNNSIVTNATIFKNNLIKNTQNSIDSSFYNFLSNYVNTAFKTSFVYFNITELYNFKNVNPVFDEVENETVLDRSLPELSEEEIISYNSRIASTQQIFFRDYVNTIKTNLILLCDLIIQLSKNTTYVFDFKISNNVPNDTIKFIRTTNTLPLDYFSNSTKYNKSVITNILENINDVYDETNSNKIELSIESLITNYIKQPTPDPVTNIVFETFVNFKQKSLKYDNNGKLSNVTEVNNLLLASVIKRVNDSGDNYFDDLYGEGSGPKP